MKKEFMLVFRNEKSTGGEQPSATQMQAVMKQWQTWIKGIAAAGKYSGTNRLLPEGKTIHPGNAITDGPYMEVKEMIGGYVIVKTDSLDEAMQIAGECPSLLYGGKVEVRAVMPIEYDTAADDFLAEKNQ